MPTIRDLLNKQKEKANGVSGQQVIQPKAVEKAPVAQETKPAEIPREVKTAFAETVIDALAGNPNGPAPMVEQRPPKGLTGLALIRWKKEHVNLKTNETVHVAKTEPTMPRTQDNGTSNSRNETPSEQINSNSASQTADAQKTNAGVADLEELRKHLAYLANSIDQKELVAQIVRTIGAQLLASPELTPQMTHAEVDLIVRGLRRGYSIAARKKSEAKEAKQVKNKDFGELGAAFAAAGLNLNLNLK